METQIFRIVFEDSELLIIEKKRPFLSQRADRSEKEGLDEFIARQLKKKIYPVHRLDREVLGLMVFGKTPQAADELTRQFRERLIQKVYWARVQGHPREEKQTLIHYLQKNPKTNRVTVFPRETPGAKRAELTYAVLERAPDADQLLVKLKTGRTHQIRVQLAKIGHPIVGDTRYSKKSENAVDSEQIQLRSVYLALQHPTSGETLEWALDQGQRAKNFFDF